MLMPAAGLEHKAGARAYVQKVDAVVGFIQDAAACRSWQPAPDGLSTP
jgi:hypothetical protein